MLNSLRRIDAGKIRLKSIVIVLSIPNYHNNEITFNYFSSERREKLNFNQDFCVDAFYVQQSIDKALLQPLLLRYIEAFMVRSCNVASTNLPLSAAFQVQIIFAVSKLTVYTFERS